MNSRYRNYAPGRALAAITFGITLTLASFTAASPVDQDPLVMQLAGVQNIARPYPWLLTGGQPDAKALATLAEAGVWDIVNLRTAAEPCDYDEPAAAKALGLLYLAIPTGAGDFSEARFTAFRKQLIAHGPRRPVFVHCGTGNRVGAALLPWLVLDQGMPEERALALAREIGLSDADLTQRALDYIHARR